MTWYKNSEGRFGKNGAKGDQGELIVEEYCKKNNISFEDRNDIYSQTKLKIDCIIDGVAVDVKTNYYKGYLAVELWTRKNTPGWIYTTTAKEIYGVDIENNAVYRYNTSDMKTFINENKKLAKKSKKGDVLMWISVKNTPFIERLQ